MQVKSLISHRLVEPTFHLEEKLCKKHDRLQDRYCRTDHTCICTSCADSLHKSHDIVSTDHEWKKKMVSVYPPLVNEGQNGVMGMMGLAGKWLTEASLQVWRTLKVDRLQLPAPVLIFAPAD